MHSQGLFPPKRSEGNSLVAFYFPELEKVLDLGCGAGRDCYILSKLVGETGYETFPFFATNLENYSYVVGVDMTDEQLEVARRHVEFHTNKFGYAKPNVEFKKGYIEKLSELGFEEGSFDLIV